MDKVLYIFILFVLLLISCQGTAQNLDFVKAGEIPTDYSDHGTMASADFDNDGDLDIVTTNIILYEVRLYLNDGDGFFSQSKQVAYLLTEPDFGLLTAVAAGDVNNDGYPDIVAAEQYIFGVGPQYQLTYARLVTFINDGNANFSRYSFTDVDELVYNSGELSVMDVENDGDLDIALTPFRDHDDARNYPNMFIVIYKNDGLGNFSNYTILEMETWYDPILVADMNNDNFPDIVSGAAANTIGIWVNDGTGSFPDELETKLSGIEWSRRATALGDVNNDGNVDVLLGEGIYLNVGSLNFDFQPFLSNHGDRIRLADFNGDGWIDMLDETEIFLNHIGTFSQDADVAIPASFYSDNAFLTGDFDKDGDIDLAFGDSQVFLNADIQVEDTGPLCNGSEGAIYFNSTIRFATANVFSVELSDSFGNFNEPMIIGSMNSTDKSGQIKIVIPDTIEAGTQYKVRVNASSPAIIGFATKSDIAIRTVPLPLLGGDIISCNRDTIISSNYAEADSYRWTTPEGLVATEPELLVAGSGYYSLTIEKFSCLFHDTVHVTLGGIEDLDFKIGGYDKYQFPETLYAQFPLELSVFANECEGCEYEWSFGNGVEYSGVSASASITEPGRIGISLDISNTYGCSGSASKEITLADLFIPNVITPNGDGRNEALVIEAAEQHPTRLTILDRWGVKVFETDKYNNQWTGEGLAYGVYFYHAEILILGKQVLRKGTLSVLR